MRCCSVGHDVNGAGGGVGGEENIDAGVNGAYGDGYACVDAGGGGVGDDVNDAGGGVGDEVSSDAWWCYC